MSLSAEHDAALGVARDLRELAWRGRLHELAGQAAREADALAVDLRARAAEELERVGRVAEVDPDLLEDRVGVLLEQRQALVGENLERRERACEERHALDDGASAWRPGVLRVRRLVFLASRSCGFLSRRRPGVGRSSMRSCGREAATLRASRA